MNDSNDIQALRAKLHGTRGRTYWRSLEEVAGDPGIQGIPPSRVSAERLGVARPGRPPRIPEADGGVDGPGRRQRLHPPARRRPSFPTSGSPKSSSRASRSSSRRRCRLPALASVFWSRATRDARPRSKATRITRPASARPTSSRRRPSSVSTIPTARRCSRISAKSARSRRLPRRFGRSSTRSRARRAAASASSARPSRRRRLALRSTSSWARFPQAKWVQWEPFGRHNVREGSRLAFGEYVDAEVLDREGRRHPRRSTPTFCVPATAR